MGAVFDLAKSLSRMQLSEEEMALFSASVLLSPGNPLTLSPIDWGDVSALKQTLSNM